MGKPHLPSVSKLRAVDDTVQRLSGHLTVWPVVAAVLTAIITGLAVVLGYATNFVRALAPISYLFVAMFAVIVATLMLWAVLAFFRWIRRPIQSSETNIPTEVIKKANISPSPAPSAPFADISLRWANRQQNRQQRVCVYVTPRRRLKDIAVIARFAIVESSMVHAVWKWSVPKRLFETRDALSGETIELEVFTRSVLSSVDDKDVITIIGEDVPGAPSDPLVGKMIRVEIKVAAGDEAIIEPVCFNFFRHENRQAVHMPDMSWLSGIEDRGETR